MGEDIMKYYIGVDLGGTNIAAGVVSEQGELIHKASVPTESHRGHEAVVADLAKLCKQVIADSDVDPETVTSIGIGLPGLFDKDSGVFIYAPNLPIRQVPIRSMLQETFPLPVYLENDANAAAMGESVAGAAKDVAHSITVTLGTGVGGGIIVDNKILHGAFGGAGEIGHMAINLGGELCGCGRRGCWEAYASASALVKQAQIAAIENPESLLAKDVNGINGKMIFEAIEQGDETAKQVLDTYLSYVAIGLTNLIDVLQPAKIVIGGGLSAQGEKILAPIRKLIEERAFSGAYQTKLVTATLGNDAGIIGAAMVGMEHQT